MAIGSVIEKGSYIYVYDEKGRQLCTRPTYNGLQGYTGTSFSVKNGAYIYVYDEKGRQLSVKSAR